ncbi:uncharacterized protein LOC135145127 [Zophobas morio]|uniref:uncharacterized protein LOC135145127 n=1 Tax=Zophobas morio TaxID=2755281 RepID=UPI00308379EF
MGPISFGLFYDNKTEDDTIISNSVKERNFRMCTINDPSTPSLPTNLGYEVSSCADEDDKRTRESSQREQVRISFMAAPVEASASTSSPLRCRYYLHGVCYKGANCNYAHDLKAEEDKTCRYYLAGNCFYGNRCRYDHIGRRRPTNVDGSMSVSYLLRESAKKAVTTSVVKEKSEDKVLVFETKLCPFLISGNCGYGDSCLYLHGNPCPVCLKPCLHPTRADLSEAHVNSCLENSNNLEKRIINSQKSKGVECGICLEVVLEKATLSNRRFGLLKSCKHAFCLPCIRKWRSERNRPKELVRQCPLCRVESFLVIPSAVWIEDDAEKEALFEQYTANLKKKDCVNYNFGEGTCPFGASCFYRHARRDGTLEKPVLRKVANADGDLTVLDIIRVSDFLNLINFQESDNSSDLEN